MHPKMLSHWSLNIEMNAEPYEDGEKNPLFDERDWIDMLPFNVKYGNFNQNFKQVKMDGFGEVTKVELWRDIVSEIKEEKENEE